MLEKDLILEKKASAYLNHHNPHHEYSVEMIVELLDGANIMLSE